MVKASRCRSSSDTATGTGSSSDPPPTGLHEWSVGSESDITERFCVCVCVYFVFCFVVFVHVLIYTCISIYMWMILFVKKKVTCNYNIKPTILFCFHGEIGGRLRVLIAPS